MTQRFHPACTKSASIFYLLLLVPAETKGFQNKEDILLYIYFMALTFYKECRKLSLSLRNTSNVREVMGIPYHNDYIIVPFTYYFKGIALQTAMNTLSMLLC